jgi:protein ImuA
MAATLRRFFSSPAGEASSTAAAAVRIERLRRELCTLEAATGRTDECGAPLPLGIPAIDGALGGGLSCGALHEIAAERETATAAASGFALALAARQASFRSRSRNDASIASGLGRNLVWIAEDLSLAENGAPYGPGLDCVGIAPERLIMIAAARARDALWAMEEALRCHAIGVVIGEMRPHGIDPVATRRLSLAAATGGTLGLILRTAPDDAPSAAATRWIVGAAPSSPAGANDERWHGIRLPRVSAHLVRNRRGHLGAWILEWNSVEQRFELATHPEPVAGAAFDRSHRAAVG